MVGQSGGPTAVINASLAGIYRRSKEKNCKIYGALNGIEGLLQDTVVPLDISQRNVELLIKTPSAALGSCRYKLLDSSVEKFQELREAFAKYDINAFLYIGGNDSMETVDKLSRHLADTGITFIGVPKTIDNDLDVTDHCPGFGSAAKYLAENITQELGCKTRAIELNIMQRCCAHLQSEFDVREALEVGEYAVDVAMTGESGKMVAIKRISNFPYSSEFFTTPVINVAGKVKYFPKKWLTLNSVLPEAKYYFSPLIGNLPDYFRF